MNGSVRKKGDRWYYRIDLGIIDGKRKQIERVGGDKKRDAVAAMQKAIAELDGSTNFIEPTKITFGEHLKNWLDGYVKTNLKPNTIDAYSIAIKQHVTPALGNIKIKNLSPIIIQDFLNAKKNDGYGKSSIRTIFVVIKKSLAYAVSPCRFIKTNPSNDLHMPRFVENKEIVASFTDYQVKTVFDKFNNNHLLFVPVRLSYYTGMRIGECLALRWQDVDMSKYVLTVKHTLADKDRKNIRLDPIKNLTPRTIEFTDKLLAVLRKSKKMQAENRLKYGQFYNDSDFVCCLDDGTNITSNNIRYFNNWCKDVFGKDSGLSVHSLRHTHATKMLENGADIKYVSTRLGHSSIKITLDTYSHVTDKMIGKNLEIIKNSFI